MGLWGRFRHNHFVQSVTVLGAGTILAQVVMVAAAPVLTRLYTPADFGLAALFVAMVSSITPALCGKYEVAVVVAKSIQQSRQLLGIALLVALGVSTLMFAGMWFYGNAVVNLFGFGGLEGWIILVPFALFSTGVLTSLNYYSNRVHEYAVISQSKVLVSVFGVVVSVIFGLFSLHYGLLLSSVLATGLASLWLLYRYRKVLYVSLFQRARHKRILVRRYRSFPIYNATTGLLDGLTQAMPIFFLSRYFPEAVVGYYALMLRVAMAPISFISGAVSQVNLKKVADLVNQGVPVRPYLLRLTMVLTLIVLPFTLLLVFYAPPLFAWIFGEQWRLAGVYLQVLMPALALRFVVSTISTTFGATGNNRLGAIWKVTAFIVSLGVFIVVAPRVDVMGMFTVILIMDLVLYGFYFLLAWRAAGHPLSYR